MLLDEPFAGIDPIAVGDIQALVRHLTSRGIGVLITDHNVRETLGLTDRAYIIYSGEVLMEGRAGRHRQRPGGPPALSRRGIPRSNLHLFGFDLACCQPFRPYPAIGR